MKENSFTPEESFAIISKAISNFKMNYKESGRSLLMWGWMLTLSCISHFTILKILMSQNAYDVMWIFSIGNWTLFITITSVIQFVMERNVNKAKKVHSHLDGYLKKIWTVSWLAMFPAIFVAIKLGIVIPTLILLIAGIATTITGTLIKFTPLTVGGISFFVFSIATTFVNNEYVLLVTAASIICGYLIPGYLLKTAKEE